MNNSDMPAMPLPDAEQWQDTTDPERGTYYATGLTKREHFAGLAMQGFIASGYYNLNMPSSTADSAVRAADALLEELDK